MQDEEIGRRKIRTQTFLLMSALFLGLVLRFGYVLYLDSTNIMTPWSNTADVHDYNNLALSLIEHHVYGYDGRPSAFRPPLYSFFLAGIYTVFGLNNFLAVRFFQALISVCTIFIIYHIAKEVYNERTGIIAAFISSGYPFLIYFVGDMLTETLFIFLLNLSVLYLFYIRRRPTSYNLFFCGVLFSLTFLCRPVLAFVPFTALWIWGVCKDKMPLLKVALFLAGMQIIIIPWVARNYRHFHSIVPFATNGGYNLSIGATTLPYDEAKIRVKEILGHNHYSIEDLSNKEYIDESKFDKEGRMLAVRLIASNPSGYIKFFIRNFFKFFLNLDFSFLRARTFGGALAVVSSLFYFALAASAVIAAFMSFKKKNVWGPALLIALVLSSALFYSLFFTGKRFRVATTDCYFIVMASYLYSSMFTWFGHFFIGKRTSIAVTEKEIV